MQICIHTQTQIHTNMIILKTSEKIHTVLANMLLKDHPTSFKELFLLTEELGKELGLTEIFLNKIL